MADLTMYRNSTNVFLVLAFTPHMSDLVAFRKICQSASSTISTNGRHSSATASMRPRRC